MLIKQLVVLISFFCSCVNCFVAPRVALARQGATARAAVSSLRKPEALPPLDTPDVSALPKEPYLVSQRMIFKPQNGTAIWQSLKFAIKPRGRLPKHRIIEVKVEGSLPLTAPSSFGASPSLTITLLSSVLAAAAHDPRIDGVILVLGDLAASTASLQELRRHLDYFAQSGKDVYGWAPRQIGIDQLYVLGGCTHRFATPEAYVSVNGFSVEVDFLRGVFDEVGIEPQVQRIGDYKSFGDRFSRRNMSDAQRETLTSLLGSVSSHKLGQLARDANVTVAELEAAIDAGKLRSTEDLKQIGLVSAAAYEDDVLFFMQERQKKRRKAQKWLSISSGSNSSSSDAVSEDNTQANARAKVQAATSSSSDLLLPLQRYARAVSRLPIEAAPGVTGDKTVAVIMAEGAIVDKTGDAAGSGELVVDKYKEVALRVLRDKQVAAVVVRISSPGGDALASDTMWRLTRLLGSTGKPVIASIGPVAASGGYYISMAADAIVAEEQSITGSIGVVTAKFSLEKLFKKASYNVERVSRGRFAEVMAFERGFTPEEAAFFSENAMQAYENFVSKAALSRGMTLDAMHRRAQGRVWTGWQGAGLGLVDELGGLSRAVEMARYQSDRRDYTTAMTRKRLATIKAAAKAKSDEPVDESLALADGPVRSRLKEQLLASSDSSDSATPEAHDDGASVAEVTALAEKSEPAVNRAMRQKLEKWGLLDWKISSYADLFSFMERARAQALSEGVAKLPLYWPLSEKEVLEVLLLQRLMKEKAAAGKAKTKVKYFEPPTNPFAALLRALNFGAVSNNASGSGNGMLEPSGDITGVAAVAAAAAALTKTAGRPMAILDDTVGRAFPGISGVPEDYRRIGMGPVMWHLLGGGDAGSLGRLILDQLGKAVVLPKQ